MFLQEYDVKRMMTQYDIPYPEFMIATTTAEVKTAIDTMNIENGVVKMQITSGGRGLVNGVKVCSSKSEMITHADEMLGKHIVTPQTGSEGLTCRSVMITRLVKIKKEYYLSIMLDRESSSIIFIVCNEGGSDIEELAKKAPQKIIKIPLNRNKKCYSHHIMNIINHCGWDSHIAVQAEHILKQLHRMFIDNEATLLEINPLVVTNENELVALDAKMVVDENALFRHPSINALFDPSDLSKEEVIARQYDLSYISLDGSIGCMVNGAGLAMATMDIIAHYGAKAANFLDVGGSANVEKIAVGLELLITNPNVEIILINIFGGIMNCETIAKGILQVYDKIKTTKPVVVRLEGMNVAQGFALLKQSSVPFIHAEALDDAAKKAVETLSKIRTGDA